MPVPAEPMNLRGTHLRDDVYLVLERLLVSGELAPGARLNDPDLLALTGTSRAPLREALHQLAAVGLVTVYPRQGTVVTPLDRQVSVDAFQIDAEVLAQALREAVPILTTADRDVLASARTGELASASAFRDAVRARRHRDVLDVFVTATGNVEYARLAAAVAPLVDRTVALVGGGLVERTYDAVRTVVDAALDRDVEGALASWMAWGAALQGDPALTTLPRGATAVPVGVTLRQKATTVIENAILDGTLIPGELIREADLMRWLGVSRTPVREALADLARRGLVVQRVHRGAQVATLDPARLGEVMRAAGVLRRLSVRLAMHNDLPALVDALEVTFPAWADVTDPDAYARAVTATMQPFSDLCGNQILVELLVGLNLRARWSASHHPLVLGGASAASTRELLDVVAAGRTGEAERAIWHQYERASAGLFGGADPAVAPVL